MLDFLRISIGQSPSVDYNERVPVLSLNFLFHFYKLSNYEELISSKQALLLHLLRFQELLRISFVKMLRNKNQGKRAFYLIQTREMKCGKSPFSFSFVCPIAESFSRDSGYHNESSETMTYQRQLSLLLLSQMDECFFFFSITIKKYLENWTQAEKKGQLLKYVWLALPSVKKGLLASSNE